MANNKDGTVRAYILMWVSISFLTGYQVGDEIATPDTQPPEEYIPYIRTPYIFSQTGKYLCSDGQGRQAQVIETESGITLEFERATIDQPTTEEDMAFELADGRLRFHITDESIPFNETASMAQDFCDGDGVPIATLRPHLRR